VFVDEATFAATDFLGTLDVFGARYGLPPFATAKTPVVLLRVFALDQFLAVFPGARVVQVEAPLDVLARRLHERGDADRAQEDVLTREIGLGREAADVIVDASGDLATNLAAFEAAILSHGHA